MRTLVVLMASLLVFGCTDETKQGQVADRAPVANAPAKDDAAQRIFGQINGNKKIAKQTQE